MQSDRELLEVAAKAAGMRDMKWTGSGMAIMMDPSRPDTTGSIGPTWNPLVDDAQALRLAVKLRLGIDHNYPADNDAWVMAIPSDAMVGPLEEVDGEVSRLAATRRAITRAAAALAQQGKKS